MREFTHFWKHRDGFALFCTRPDGIRHQEGIGAAERRDVTGTLPVEGRDLGANPRAPEGIGYTGLMRMGESGGLTSKDGALRLRRRSVQ